MEENNEEKKLRKLAGGAFEDAQILSQTNRDALQAEKKRMGLKGNSSISGNEAFEKYLTSALAFREGGGGMGDVFAAGKQDPEAMARFLAEDMNRLIGMNHKALFSSKEKTAMQAHSDMLKFERLGEGINGVIKYAKDNNQEKLLKFMKKGADLKKFQRKQGRFEKAMSGAEKLRDTRDRYYKTEDTDEKDRLAQKLRQMKEQRVAAMKAAKKFRKG